MARIQGVPDLGPGLRLHLNENTGGCSPKVVEAVRSFDGPALATYPDYRAAVIETAEHLKVEAQGKIIKAGGVGDLQGEGIARVARGRLARAQCAIGCCILSRGRRAGAESGC